MERTGHAAAGVAGQPSEAESTLLRELVEYLRQKRPELREEWAPARITDAHLLQRHALRRDLLGGHGGVRQLVDALETGSVEALRA